MNKECPLCKRKVTKKQDHVFVYGQRWHKICAYHNNEDKKVYKDE
jgi:hypothetical protein